MVDSLDVRVLEIAAKLNYFKVYLTAKNDLPAEDKRRFLFQINLKYIWRREKQCSVLVC